MSVNEVSILMNSNLSQNVNFIKIYYKKRQIGIFLENVCNLKNN